MAFINFCSGKQQLLIEQLQCENERIELSQAEYNLQETVKMLNNQNKDKF